MKISGIFEKMRVKAGPPVAYSLALGEVHFDLNSYVGKDLCLSFEGKIFCTHCGKQTKKSYGQGFCFPCTVKLAQCDLCILRPETCHYDQGTCREPQWGEEHCLKPHVIYLANSSGLKVGITRKTQVPIRWLDQGATQALPILEVSSRLQSGRIEMLFKRHINDRTDWRKMLKGEAAPMDLVAERDRLLALLEEDLRGLEHSRIDSTPIEFEYPVLAYPEKVSSYNLDKVPIVKSRLVGIKGQYLIFENGVLNVRSHSGYLVTIEGDHDGTKDDSPTGLQAVTLSH